MSRLNDTGLPKRRLLRLCACLLGGMAFVSAIGAGQSSAADADALEKHDAAATSYHVINLRPATENLTGQPAFNAKDQLAFSTNVGLSAHGWFYDGKSVVDIGSLNGQSTFVSGLNNAGQVTGDSFIRDLGGVGGSGEIYHAFLWSKSSGMRDLGNLGGMYSSIGNAINNLGQVVGTASAPDGRFHAFRWSASEGMLDLGLLSSRPDGRTVATAINDAGKVVGGGDKAVGNSHAFLWARDKGLVDLGTLGGNTSFAFAIAADGLVAGESTVHGSFPTHAFVWTRASGMQDVGPRGDAQASVRGMSANRHMYGVIFPRVGGRHAFSWTRESGMVVIGTLGGSESVANAGNNRRQVVGGSFTRNDEEFHAFIWTPKEGVVDLNRRLRHAPAGLVVGNAYAISDNGFILATSNAGVVLLVPDCHPVRTHTVGPLTAPGLVQLGQSFESSVSFSDGDTAAGHNVMWNWGDGTGDQQGNARESKGLGVASANHAYTAQGIHTVTAKVGDRSGAGPVVSRTIVAYDPASGASAGSGWFMSPYGAHKAAGSLVEKAEFSFVLPSAGRAGAGNAKPQLNFSAAGLRFSSDNFRLAAMQGARAQFEGSGTINGRGDYMFTLKTTAGPSKGEPARFGLKIWHTDPATRAAVVDYDNQGEDQGRGSSFQGEIQAASQ